MQRRTGGRVSNGGFTLIELLVVMVILAVLAAAVIPRVVGRTEDAKRARAVADIESVGTALDMYHADNGSYPTTEQGLTALRQAPTSDPVPKAWNGPYLKKALPMDPWGNDYVYTSPGEHNPDSYDLISHGADGQPGGTGRDADIGNWDESENGK
jgi:general secretion pathway protein G